MNRTFLAALLTLSVSLSGETTKKWEQSTFDEFEKGTANGLSIRSDGKLMLAPKLEEIHEASSSYFWSLATDSRGNLFAGAGPEAKVFRIAPNGDSSVFFETDAVEIHALAVDGDDNLYAATSPDSQVFKITPNGAASVFFDPDAAYIWGMAFDSKGNLFLAGGDNGRIFRVTPAGEGSVFFETEETHVRAIVIDSSDNLIVGTDPGGLILRISGEGAEAPTGFVLYQSSKREITALAQASDGTIYAAGVGNRKAAPAVRPATTPKPTPPRPNQAAPGSPQAKVTAPSPRPVPSALFTNLTGGSEVYRIAPDGEPLVAWSSTTDLVYTLGFDSAGRLLIGSGDRGRLIRLDSETLSSLVLKSSSTQITALAAGPAGKVFAATSSVGKIYALGPELERKGSFESEPHDAKIFSQWGRLQWRGEASGDSSVSVSLRTGNLNSPARNWSDWSQPVTDPDGARAGSPSSRFAQWRAVLESPDGRQSPLLDAVSLYYFSKNVAPRIETVEVTPPSYAFVRKAIPATANRSLPPIGSKPPAKPPRQPRQGQTLTARKGYIGVRWAADDANSDTLIYKLEIRGSEEQQWKLLEEDQVRDYFSWDTTSFADGSYRVRITASDEPSNPEGEALTDSRASAPFVIDNSSPAVSDLRASMADGKLRVEFAVADTATKIRKAEYSLDGSDWKPILPASRLFDSKQLTFDFETEDVEPGEHTVAVRVYDGHHNLAAAKVVIRDVLGSDGNGS